MEEECARRGQHRNKRSGATFPRKHFGTWAGCKRKSAGLPGSWIIVYTPRGRQNMVWSKTAFCSMDRKARVKQPLPRRLPESSGLTTGTSARTRLLVVTSETVRRTYETHSRKRPVIVQFYYSWTRSIRLGHNARSL